MAYDQEKEAAARASMSFVKNGDVVGLGSGSTATFAIQLLGQRVKQGLKITGVPTSNHTKELALSLGISLVSLQDVPQIDVTIDGADEIDPKLRLIKGGGGALLHEKIVASASKKVVIIGDSSKRVPVLARAVPVEVIAFAQPLVKRKIEHFGSSVALRQEHGQPFVTDEGHHILDCSFGKLTDPAAVARSLKEITGVVEHGLFIGIASTVLIADGDKVTQIEAGNL